RSVRRAPARVPARRAARDRRRRDAAHELGADRRRTCGVRRVAAGRRARSPAGRRVRARRARCVGAGLAHDTECRPASGRSARMIRRLSFLVLAGLLGGCAVAEADLLPRSVFPSTERLTIHYVAHDGALRAAYVLLPRWYDPASGGTDRRPLAPLLRDALDLEAARGSGAARARLELTD